MAFHMFGYEPHSCLTVSLYTSEKCDWGEGE